MRVMSASGQTGQLPAAARAAANPAAASWEGGKACSSGLSTASLNSTCASRVATWLGSCKTQAISLTPASLMVKTSNIYCHQGVNLLYRQSPCGRLLWTVLEGQIWIQRWYTDARMTSQCCCLQHEMLNAFETEKPFSSYFRSGKDKDQDQWQADRPGDT